MDAVDPEAWPLIGFQMEDAVYRQHFVEMVAQVSSEVFTPQRMMPIYEQNFAMLAAYLSETEGDEAVKSLREATDELINHVQDRAIAAEEFMAGQVS